MRISALSWDWPQVPDVLEVRLTFRDLQPELANKRTATLPPAQRVVDPAPPGELLNPDDLLLLAELERQLNE